MTCELHTGFSVAAFNTVMHNILLFFPNVF